MPWKGEKNPYRIWLSEVILQQTRVEQGLGYYERFIRRYPDIHRLAAAPDDQVFKLWEGLGYYSRCRNLLSTARLIVSEYEGHFPEKYEEIRALKGVGPYIAAAISSFAFNLPFAVVDGNVFRVLSRVFGVDLPIDSTAGKKRFSELAAQHLDEEQPGTYNQAIMDFGAVICKPVSPLCAECPMNKICIAFQTGMVNQLPVKEKVLRKKTRWMYYFLFVAGGKVMVQQRTGRDIWQQLFEFYLFESPAQLSWDEARVGNWLRDQFGLRQFSIRSISLVQQQQLTHQTVRGQAIVIDLEKIPPPFASHKWVTRRQLKQLPFPKFINHFLETIAL